MVVHLLKGLFLVITASLLFIKKLIMKNIQCMQISSSKQIIINKQKLKKVIYLNRILNKK